MKKTIFFSIFLTLTFCINAQTIHFAKSAIGNRLDEGNGIAIDNNGNTYITGQFESATLNFGTVSITNNSTNNDADAFVAKFDVSGNCLWAKTIGGVADEFGSAIDVDNNGNVFVTGYFESASVTVGSQTLTSYGDRDIFIVKLSTSGDFLWAKGAGGNYEDESYGISCDGNGNAYITGYYWSNSVNFGSSSITSAGDVDAFLAKYNSDGTLAWAKTVGGEGDDRGTALVSDDAGNVYITGGYESSSLNFGAATLTNGETYKKYMYVAKYNTSGTNLWAKSASSAGARTYGAGISLDQTGNCYIGGVFDGTTANFGTHTITNNKPGGSNAFIAKYNSSGVDQWASNAVSGPEGNQTYCITTDNAGNSYISGWFTSPTVTFGGIVLSSSAYGDNIFLVKYNTSGQVTNAYAFKGSGMSGGYGNALCSDNYGNAYLTGYFEGTNMIFGSTTLTNTGSYDVYWTKASAGATGITELYSDSKLRIYPNPIQNIASIKLSSNVKNAQLKVFNVFGQLVREIKNINGNQISFNREDLPAGIYSFQLLDNEKVSSQTIVIE